MLRTLSMKDLLCPQDGTHLLDVLQPQEAWEESMAALH